MMFVIIEPSRYVHTTAVRPWVRLLNLPDGQRHIALGKISHEQVPLRQPADDWCPVWLDHLVATASVGYGPSAPAGRQPAIVFDIIIAYQRNIRSHCGYQEFSRHTAWKEITFLRKTHPLVILKSSTQLSYPGEDCNTRQAVCCLRYSFYRYCLTPTKGHWTSHSAISALKSCQITGCRPWYAHTNNFVQQKRNVERGCFLFCGFGSSARSGTLFLVFWWLDRDRIKVINKLTLLLSYNHSVVHDSFRYHLFFSQSKRLINQLCISRNVAKL